MKWQLLTFVFDEIKESKMLAQLATTVRCVLSAVSLLIVVSGTAEAIERYTEAKITQIEPGDNGITLFLSYVSGDALPVGNGGSNEPINKPMLFLANSAADIANRKHFLATAIVAMNAGSTVRFRWEDAGENFNRISIMLVRQ